MKILWKSVVFFTEFYFSFLSLCCFFTILVEYFVFFNGNGCLHHSPLPVSTVNFHPVLCPVVQPQTLVHIKQAEAGGLVLFRLFPCNQLSHLVQLLGLHTDSVVPDAENQMFSFPAPVYPDMSHTPFILNPVIEGILYQRLQGQLQNGILAQLLGNPDFVFQNILVALLLNLEITGDMGLFFLESNIIFPLI